jgi:hypothetical protein
MPDLVMIKRNGALVAGDAEAEEALAKIPSDTFVMANVRRPRNIDHHRKFFKLMRVISDGTGIHPEVLRALILIEAGHCHVIKRKDGRIDRFPKSIDFTSVDQTEFEEIYNRAVQYIAENIVPGMNVNKDLDELLR